jgi:hypothetical protein
MEHSRGGTFPFADEAEHEMLDADVVVVEADRLVLGQRENALGAVVEAIERTRRPYSSALA